LRAGRWYYVVDATISTVAPDESNGSVSETLRRLVLGGGPRQDLSQARTAYFTIRR
jgi:hypothetical protein